VHANAAELISNRVQALENVGGPAIVAAGCDQCHGSKVKVKGDGTLDSKTWPNSGIGRINPDGSKGSCNACHSRHTFEAKLSRSPENCGKCHLGPDHPQMEIYNEMKKAYKEMVKNDKT